MVKSCRDAEISIGIPNEDKIEWRAKPPFFEVSGEHVYCPPGYHYVKGYPTKRGYSKGYCAKNPRRKFKMF